MDGSQILCQVSTGQETDWKDLYEAAFPQDERHPVEDLRKSMAAGTVMLHRTMNKAQELLCFSVTNLMSNFCLLAYLATDSTKRSTGVGSKHMKRLIDDMKQAHPSYLGMFLEIESTKEAGLDAETQKMRNRRLAFYQRLGAKRLHNKSYLMPSYGSAHGKTPPREGELLWIEFNPACITEAALPAIIEEIFCKAYGLAKNDPLVQKVVGQFGNSASSCAGKTEVPSGSSTTNGAPVDAAQTSAPATKSDSKAPQAADTTPAPAKGTEPAPAKADATPAPPTTAKKEPAPAKADATPAPATTAKEPAPAKADATTVPTTTAKESAPAKADAAPVPSTTVKEPAPAKVDATPVPTVPPQAPAVTKSEPQVSNTAAKETAPAKVDAARVPPTPANKPAVKKAEKPAPNQTEKSPAQDSVAIKPTKPEGAEPAK
jgi:hypothetical protein